jgi:hypothetical protein
LGTNATQTPFGRYGYGQCNFGSSGATNFSATLSDPDAATMLRSFGKRNYRGCGQSQACGYWVDISYVQPTATSPTSPNSPYKNIPIWGYDNSTIYDAYILYSNATTQADPQIDYKEYLSKAQMDYYLGFIPTIITNNIPTGKDFYDFDVNLLYCLCYATQNPSSPYPNLWTTHRSFQYWVRSGVFVNDCGGWVGLPRI